MVYDKEYQAFLNSDDYKNYLQEIKSYNDEHYENNLIYQDFLNSDDYKNYLQDIKFYGQQYENNLIY